MITPDHGPHRPSAGTRSALAPWILLADDDDIIRGMWAGILRNVGYRVVEARNGRDALELIHAVVPHLVILDLHMPGLTGDEVLARLETDVAMLRIPILIVSGFLEEDPPRHGLRLNIVGRVSKPIRLDDLLDTVRATLIAGPP